MRLPWASRRKSASVVPLFLVSIFGEETSRRYVGQAPSFYTATIVMIQCEAPKISKLVYNSNNDYGLWYLYVFITIVTGAYKPTYNWGASHSMDIALLYNIYIYITFISI